jgi:hypothetical protein
MAGISFPDWEQLASRALNVKGPGPFQSIDDAAVGVWRLGYGADPEYRALQGIRTFAGAGTQTAVAGQFSYVSLSNPTTSNRLAVVTHICMLGPAFALIGRRRASGLVGVSFANGFWRDSRQPTVQAEAVLTRTTNAGIFATEAGMIPPFRYEPVDFVLFPGSEVWLRATTVNADMTVGFVWYERDPQPGEP